MEKINLSAHLMQQFSKHDQNKIAIKDDDSQILYKEMPNAIFNCAWLLEQQDVRPGDRIAMLMGDSIEWVISFFAVLYIGAVPVLLSPKIPKKNLENMIENCHARYIINSQCDIDLANLNLNQKIKIIQKKEILNKYDYKSIVPYAWHPDEMSIWCSSSGTSGKGQQYVIHRHETFFEAIKMNIEMHDITSQSVIFSSAKLSFQYGLMNMIYGLVQGGQVILSNKIPARKYVCKIIKLNKVTHFYTTPTIISSMVKIRQSSDDLQSTNYVICGGEPLPKFIEKQFFKLYNKLIFNGIGMAELITWATSQNPTRNKFGTIGVPMPGSICEIRKEDGKLCGIGELGELYIKQPTTALMYWNFAQNSRETFINGWFKSRDIVYWDDEGYIIYVCRSDDLIRIKESYVNPIDIEEEILRHPSIEECVVLSIKNKFDMPEISSKIVLKSGKIMTPSELRTFLSTKLESYKIPKYIDFVGELSKTVTTKKIRN